MLSENILKNLSQGNLVQAKEETESLLYQKLNDAIGNFETNYISDVYSQSKGVASIVDEKKKANDDEEETKYAKSTDKENDSEDDSGETLDPVGKGDDDIDNDGDSDSSDDYLKNRRKKIGKAINNDKVDEDNIQEIAAVAAAIPAIARGAGMVGKAAMSKTGQAALTGYEVNKFIKDKKKKSSKDNGIEVSSEGIKAAGVGAGIGAVVGGPVGAVVGGALGSAVGNKKKEKEVNETDAEAARMAVREKQRKERLARNTQRDLARKAGQSQIFNRGGQGRQT